MACSAQPRVGGVVRLAGQQLLGLGPVVVGVGSSASAQWSSESGPGGAGWSSGIDGSMTTADATGRAIARTSPVQVTRRVQRPRCSGRTQPIAGATWRAIVSSSRALYSTPSMLGTVSSRVSASRTAASLASSSASWSGSPT